MPESTILTHADPDGICAGAIALSRFPGSDVFFTRPTSFYPDLLNTKAKRIIITDIALTKQDAPRIVDLFERKKMSGSEIMYFDHHIIPNTISRTAVGTFVIRKKEVSIGIAQARATIINKGR